ncbi:MAG: OmpA family protein, partial [Proteobacteria bacterium]|nr:OmpA family protein [Pseudomonadota bacterium]
DLIVESLEKFQSDSGTRNNVGEIIKMRLSATAAQLGVTGQEISQPKHSVVIMLPAEVMFKPDTNKLSASAKILLKEVADTIEPFGNEFDLTVTGHTAPGDFSRLKLAESGGEVDAWFFSASRAASVVSELIKQGARPNRLRATGLADTRSLFPVRRPDGSLNPEAAKQNRRIEIEITSQNNKPAVMQ